MIKIIKFIADDGKEFDDENECEEYELLLEGKKVTNALHFYDNNHNPIRYNTKFDFGEVMYVEVLTGTASSFLRRLCDYQGFMCPCVDEYGYNLTGRFFYDDYKNEWKSLEKEQRNLDMIAEVFEKKLDKFPSWCYN